MSKELQGRRVAFLVANDGVEQVELTEPWSAVEDAGGEPVLVALEAGKVQGRNHLDEADMFDVDVTIEDASVEDYDALVLPGGVANPDELRTRPEAVDLRALVRRRRQADRSDLPRPVDARRGRHRARPAADELAEPAHRHHQCRR